MVESNNLNLGMRCIKYMIFIISFMFLLTAFLLITVGSTITSIYGDFAMFVDDHFFSPANLMIAIGIILLVVSMIGVIGAIKESTIIINVFGLFLSVIFILEVSAAISAYMLQSQVTEMLLRTMNSSLHEYNTNEYVAKGVDFMQTNLDCCGVVDPNDWSGLLDGDKNRTVVPDSCCRLFKVEDTDVCDSYHEIGCLPRMNFIISQSTMLIATGASTVAFVQFLGVICAFMLAKTIRRTKSIRAARQWQLQQGLGILTNPFGLSTVDTVGGKRYNPDPVYTQMEKSEKSNDYVATSPSIM